MPSSVLERFSVVDVNDLDAFRACVSRALTPHKLEMGSAGDRLNRVAVAVALFGPVSLIYGEHHGASLRANLTEQVDYYDVNLSWGGRNRISSGKDQVLVDAHTAGIISPRMKAQMELSDDYRQLHVRFERFALERHLEQLLGKTVVTPIRFDMAMDLRSRAAASWAQAVRVLVEDIDGPTDQVGLAGSLEGVNPWSPFLMTGLLLAQPHNYSDQLAERRHGAHRPTPVKRAVDLIESHPEEDLSVERLAAEAGISPRSLQRHFRESVGISPQQYVRQVRLARVRDDLLAARPDVGVTVADVALRWGFSHVPRFAGAYLKRYGESPSTTLRELP